MEVSSCCGAPVIIKYQSDVTNYSDDEYDLLIPIQVCSTCGKVISKPPSPKSTP